MLTGSRSGTLRGSLFGGRTKQLDLRRRGAPGAPYSRACSAGDVAGGVRRETAVSSAKASTVRVSRPRSTQGARPLVQRLTGCPLSDE